MTDNNWHACPPPAPGDYLTRRDLSIEHLGNKLVKIRCLILEGHYNGERWNLPAEPNYYREVPGGARKN